MKSIGLIFCLFTTNNLLAETQNVSNLTTDTEVEINLNQLEFFSTNKLHWEIQDIKCSISTYTYYDEELVRNLQTIRYQVTSADFQESKNKYVPTSTSIWRATLDHNNKSLPKLELDCYTRGGGELLLSNVENLTNKSVVFVNPVYRTLPVTPINQLIPKFPKFVKSLIPLSFSFKSINSNSGHPTYLYFVNGVQLAENQDLTKSSSFCELSYNWRKLDSDQHITLPPETNLNQTSISLFHSNDDMSSSYQLLYIQSNYSDGITIKCSAINEASFKEFSEVQKHLMGVIEFQF